MTAVFSLTWHFCGLGLHPWPSGQAGFATLRRTFNSFSLSKQHLPGLHSCTLTRNARPTIAFYAPFLQPNGQARCASLRKSEATTPLRPKATQNKTPISRAEVNAIFGLKVGRKDGNDLLERLQEQRHRGTLDQKLPYSDAMIDKGLTYLRAKYPLDEDAAIIARIDREVDGEYRLPQTNVDKSPYAVSQFEKLVQENQKRREEDAAKKETKSQDGTREKIPRGERRVSVRDGGALVQLRPEPEWVRKYRDKAQMKEIPQMSALAKILPSGLFTVAVIAVAVLFAQNYKQPSRKARLWPDLPPAAATLLTLVGVNVTVFMLWRLPPLWKFLNRNFLVVPAYPYSVSMLAACFSHQNFTHLLTNMIPMWLIGTRRMSALGPPPFNTLGLTMLNSTR